MPIVEGIAKTFGPDCEVVLHDLSHPRTSVIKVVNNHITGRKVGDGIRDLILTVLRSNELENDILANYETITNDNRLVKSTTMLIKDPDNNELIGCLCINYDLKNFELIRRIVSSYMNVKQIDFKDDNGEKNPKVYNKKDEIEVVEILESLIAKSIEETGGIPETMTKAERINIMKFLEEKGVFLIKGAVHLVAKELKISVFTVYNYLDVIRSSNI